MSLMGVAGYNSSLAVMPTLATPLTPLDTVSPLGTFIANATTAVSELSSQWLASRLAWNESTDVGIHADALQSTNALIRGTMQQLIQNPSTVSVSDFVTEMLTNASMTLNATSASASASATTSATVSMHNDTIELADLYGSEEPDIIDEISPCHPENPNFNCSRDEYLEYRQGPQRLPLLKVLLVTIIFGGIFITSVLGNVLVCVVIVRHSTMHTATNYYLFSLAVSDLLYLLMGLPTEIFLYWHQYPYLFGLPFCKIRAFISEASTYVSVLTIVAFSMERFLAICHPLHLYAMSGFKRALRIIAALWIVSFISAIPFGLMTGIQYEYYPMDNSTIAESAFCAVVDIPVNFPLFELSFCIFFVIPMLLIIILYGRMGAAIRSRTVQQLGVQHGSMHNESRHQQSRKAVIRMLAAVVITFFVCWLPFHVQRLYFLYAKDHPNYQEINEYLFSIGGFAYYISCTINPILYNVMSHRYRVAFKDILCGKRRSVYYNNGFARDQSSFREATMASSVGGGTHYDRVQSVRVRSVRHKTNTKERDSSTTNSLWVKNKEFQANLAQDVPENPTNGTNVVVVVDNGVNGRPKVYTENEAQEALISKSKETCI